MLETQTAESRDAAAWLTGPVAITGADGHVGQAVQARLAATSNESRPVGRRDDLSVALRDATAVIHLAGALQVTGGNTYQEANVETVRRTIAGLPGSSVKRLVFLSYVGADPGSHNDYLRTKGEAEQLVTMCGRQAVILRSTFIFGPPDSPGPSASPFISKGGKSVTVIGTGRQRSAPVFVRDVAEVLVRFALAAAPSTDVYTLGGPDTMMVDEFVDTLSGRDVRKRHFGPRLARALAHVVPSLTPAMFDVLSADSLPDAGLPLAADAIGLKLHHLEAVYGLRVRATDD